MYTEPKGEMGTPIKVRLFLSCFLLIGVIAFAVDLSRAGSPLNRAAIVARLVLSRRGG